jgi:hypothetical protein
MFHKRVNRVSDEKRLQTELRMGAPKSVRSMLPRWRQPHEKSPSAQFRFQPFWASCGTRPHQCNRERRGLARQTRAFWLKQRSHEEGMAVQFHGAHFSVFILGGGTKRGG